MTLSLEKKRQQSFFRAVEDSKMASAGEDKKALVLMVADSLRQILFDVSSMQLVSLIKSLTEWPPKTNKF